MHYCFQFLDITKCHLSTHGVKLVYKNALSTDCPAKRVRIILLAF